MNRCKKKWLNFEIGYDACVDKFETKIVIVNLEVNDHCNQILLEFVLIY